MTEKVNASQERSEGDLPEVSGPTAYFGFSLLALIVIWFGGTAMIQDAGAAWALGGVFFFAVSAALINLVIALIVVAAEALSRKSDEVDGNKQRPHDSK